MARFVMDRLDGTTPSSARSKIEWKLHTNNVHSSRVRGEARQLFTLSFLDQNAASYKDWHRRHYLVQLSGRFQFRLDKDTTKWPASFNAGLGVPPEYPIKWSDDTAALPEATKEALSNWARHTNLLIEEAVQEYSGERRIAIDTVTVTVPCTDAEAGHRHPDPWHVLCMAAGAGLATADVKVRT